MARNFSSIALATTLTADITNVATTMTVGATTGFPSVPFTLVIEPGTANAEVVEVTTVASLTLTIIRARAGTTGVAHLTGSVVQHAISSDDVEENMVIATATRTLTSQTAAQAIFATGSFNAQANTTYMVEALLHLTTMSATSGTFGWAWGGTATMTSMHWTTTAIKAATVSGQATWSSSFNTTASNATLVTANTNTAGVIRVSGIFRVNAAGTIIPQVSLGVANAAVVQIGSYCRFTPVAPGSSTNLGSWA